MHLSIPQRCDLEEHGNHMENAFNTSKVRFRESRYLVRTDGRVATFNTSKVRFRGYHNMAMIAVECKQMGVEAVILGEDCRRPPVVQKPREGDDIL